MDTDVKSTNEIRMIASEVVQQQAKVCEAQLGRLRDRVGQNTKDIREMDQSALISTMREGWGEFKGEVRTQMRITWTLLFLILSGMVGIAFKVWGAAP